MANFGDIGTAITIGALQSIRRSAEDDAFEAYDVASGVGATALADLTDVSISGVSDGQVLTYDGDTSTWMPTTISGSNPSLIQHSQLLWTIEGTNLAVADQGVKPLKIRLPYVGSGATIEEVYLQLGTAPSTASIEVDILKNGSTIHSGTEYVEITVSGTTASRTTNFVDDGAIAKDDYFQLELVQGDDDASDLVTHLRYKWELTES